MYGRLRRILCFVALVSAVLGSAVPHITTAQPTPGNRLDELPPAVARIFRNADRNGDGKIQRSEAPLALRRRFAEIDADADGAITPAEAAAALGRRAGENDAPQIEVIADIRYTDVPAGVDPNLLSLDIHRPGGLAADAKRPVIVMIHGGGWRTGDKANAGVVSPKAGFFVGKGLIFVSINYRLSPAIQHPVHVQDCAAAVAWVHDHIAKHGGDPDRIAVMGHSAGAHLAALVATDATRLGKHDKPLSIIKACVPLDVAAYDLPRLVEIRGALAPMLKQAFGEEPDGLRDASPQWHVDLALKLDADKRPEFPPTLVVYTSRRMGAAAVTQTNLAETLTKLGAPSTTFDAVGKSHADCNADVGKPGDPLHEAVWRHLRLHLGLGPKLSDSPAFTDLLFTRDLVPGRVDDNGAFLDGTETNYIVTHDGKLWASLGAWNDDRRDTPNPGPMIVVKPAAGEPWRVDHAFGETVVRAEFLGSMRFTTDAAGKRLPTPVDLLVAGISPALPRVVAVAVRDDARGEWTRQTLSTEVGRADGRSRPGVRVLTTHVDRVTGIHYIFAAAAKGAIFRGAYDPAVPGKIRWAAEPELDGTRKRIHAFGEIDGTLYASVGVDPQQPTPKSGGLFRRVDGPKPRWEWIYQWEWSHPRAAEVIERDGTGSAKPGLRGLTPLADGDRTILLGAREHPGVIERIDPAGSPHAVLDLDIRDYFSLRWPRYDPVRGGVTLFAYNDMTPATHPDTGERVHLIGGWVRHPDAVTWEPHAQGGFFLIRHADGSYNHGYVHDPADDNANRLWVGLRGVRTICPSPFPTERGRVWYFGGFDAANGPHQHTAWLYRGEIPKPEPAASETR
jgi:arylformamidase